MHRWEKLLKDWPIDVSYLSYNVAPTDLVPIVAASGTMLAHWGIIPRWAKEFKMSFPTFNARVETIGEKPSFKQAYREGRTCIVPAAGYYEWSALEGEKSPFVVHEPEGVLWLAGLWEPWRDKRTFSIITEPAKESLAQLHPRMPVSLDFEQAALWLENSASIKLASKDLSSISYYQIDKRVGKVVNDDPELILPKKNNV